MSKEHHKPDHSGLGPVIIDIEGLELSQQDRDLLLHPLIGGVIFFSRNYKNRQQIQALVESIRAIRPNLLLSVDQEGGRVQRFKSGFTVLPPMQVFSKASPDAIEAVLPLARDCGWLLASEILACDIDLSFAPVLDVDDVHCKAIANRSFSPNPQQVVALAGAFIEGMHDAGMAATGKHFPGHGSVVEDSHLSLPVDNRPFQQIIEKDWLPFAQLSAQLDGIMPAHLVIPAVDQQSVGFSPIWLQHKLRGELNFKGVIFSDDLTMKGAASAGGYGDRAELALSAGCDALLICNNRDGAVAVLKRLEQKDTPINNRLDSMRKRKTVAWPELQANPRWQNTRTQLEALVNSANP